ncbi:formylglycine-generating enzyme family protein [Metabacillus sediminilitoris]|nr:formylglycine-generating enzyme family protein [Metabacillus sediminilitoris]
MDKYAETNEQFAHFIEDKGDVQRYLTGEDPITIVKPLVHRKVL